MAGENCRSGCRERTHLTYGECLRSAKVATNLVATPRNGLDRELELYRSVRQQGIQPASTRTADSLAALEHSDRHGVAFNAETMGAA